ncbi:hypothetical protein KEM48_001860 [Puccinia striiformis f. sp. tritici PST-130]|nr:hypothetical protein KEM48_001860 [Puccinia striiformis f. sp. tritici PST-130]
MDSVYHQTRRRAAHNLASTPAIDPDQASSVSLDTFVTLRKIVSSRVFVSDYPNGSSEAASRWAVPEATVLRTINQPEEICK